MNYKTVHLTFLLSFFISTVTIGQTIRVEGNIYDKTNYVPIPKVNVYTASGNISYSDSSGKYSIVALSERDSIWFSYEGKSTKKYLVDTIYNTAHFDLSIHVTSPLKNYLPTVVVRTNKDFNYYLDSIENRKEYAKIFNPDKGGVRLTQAQPGTFGIGLDFDAIVDAFKFKQNKRKEIYKKWITEEEQYNYVKHRYTPTLVAKLTKLSNEELKQFMDIYRPNYYMLTQMDDWDLGIYIQNCLKEYKGIKATPKSRTRTNIFAEPED